MPTKIEQLRDLAKGLGGMYREFNQSYPSIKGARVVAGLYTSDKANLATNTTELYVGGMCHTMSLYWIVGQIEPLGAKRTRFIEWVVPGGDTGAINMDAVGVLVSKTVMYKAKGQRASDMGIGKDPGFDISFMQRHRIHAKNESASGFGDIRTTVGRAKDRFYLVSYHGPNSGHACAAQSTSKGGYAYFDPNYGEAMLFSRKAWETYYDGYLTISGYKTKYTRSQTAEAYKADGTT